MANIEPWGLWHSKALAAGVGAALMSLGRSVILDYWRHGRDHAAQAGEGAYAGLGADRHHAMMIAMARQKPDLASACFAAALAVDADAEEKQAALSRAEERHADNSLQRHSPAWYRHVYALDGCVWEPD